MSKRKNKKRGRRMDSLVWATTGALVAASLTRELRRPPAERTWQGRIVGVPYDYRLPSVEKVRSAWWAPEDRRLFMPKVFGVGWDVNFGRVVTLGRQKLAERKERQSVGGTSS
ncbi:DUF5808 domain-containing protein [Actinopolymorpha rutila]|uniref:DUF5808 domain-containing protein n=1 Tax=Actinopolymorpha rutila TaxID=446787 RepID=A0A852ZI94_9ACTN|nr:DUF5808 domain-containing protein [Actinopolymorpha rutila]NYH88820.1 hypothetical protein [Actinopolymorpha rutila]